MKWKTKKNHLIITCLVLLAFQITIKLVFSPTNTDNVNISSGVYLQPTTWIKPALSFDGTNDYVEIGNDTSLHLTTDLTIETWVNTKSGCGNTAFIVSKLYSVGGDWGYDFYLSSGKPRLTAWNGTDLILDYTSTSSDLRDDIWHHLIVTYNSVNVNFFVDSNAKGSFPESDVMDASKGSLYLGARKGTSGWYNGTIDEVRVYSRALSLPRIEYSYNDGRGYHTPYSTTDLELWLKLNENSGIVAEDSSGNDNDGTIYGASWDRGKVVLGIVQNRYTLSSTTSVRNLTLNSGTLRLSKGSNAYEIACSTNDDVMITINKWFYSDITQFRPLAEVESTLSFTVNSRNKGEPQAISGVSSWSFDDDTTTMSLTTANYSLVTIRWESAGTQMVVWWLDRMMTWIGISGFFLIMLAPTMLVYYGKQDNWGNAFTYSLMFFVIGMALVIGWLWG